MYRTVKYLEWAHLKPTVKYNLSTSGMASTTPEDLRLRVRGLQFSGPNQYGYTPLMEAIARHYHVDPRNVVSAGGTSMANFLVCAALIDRGDEVIIEKPAYGPLLDLPIALGANIKRLPRRFEDGFHIDTAQLKRIASRKTKLLILTNTHNPSGVRIPQRTIEEIGEIARALKFHILVDEVYLDFLFDDTPPTSFRVGPQFVATNSLTKVYGLDGLRCGWIFCSEKLARRMWRVRDYVDVNGPFPAEWISAKIFPRLSEILDQTKRVFESAIPIVQRFIESHPSLSWVPPDGGIICFPRLRGAARMEKFHEKLIQEHSTMVVPGKFFEANNHFRLGFGVDTDVLQGGLHNIGKLLKSGW